MFDITSSKLLILGIVALIVVGPKELPMLLRTIGKYMGMIRRQATEFRTQFDDAMRESELDQIRKDVEKLGQDTENTFRDAESSINQEMSTVEQDVNSALDTAVPDTHNAVPHDTLNGLEPSHATPAPEPAIAAVETSAPAHKTGT
jgi:sec-independent protein translocase protein TatB